MNKRILIVSILLALAASACGSITISTLPAAVATQETHPIAATELPVQPEKTSENSTAWKEVRDPRYGFGLAVPCWWPVDPLPTEGLGGVMTVKNYDEAYFNAHSNKGYWNWPNGALKVDVVVMEGVDPAKSDADAYMQFADPTMTGLVSAESGQFGAHTATVVTLSNLVNTDDPNTKMFVFRLTPGTLLLVAPIPQTIIDTPDFQALLASVVLTPDEPVALPTITPKPALIDAACATG